jgi:hypothetical protein
MEEKKQEYFPRPTIWNIAQLSEDQLDEISMFIGGNREKQTDNGYETSHERCDTVIMEWADPRINETLSYLAEMNGYEYGAERSQLVATTGEQAILMDIVPKLPYNPELARDEKGEINQSLLYSTYPEQNPDNIFYGWNEAGKTRIRQYFNSQSLHRPWVKLDNYYLKFALATKLESDV